MLGRPSENGTATLHEKILRRTSRRTTHTLPMRADRLMRMKGEGRDLNPALSAALIVSTNSRLFTMRTGSAMSRRP